MFLAVCTSDPHKQQHQGDRKAFEEIQVYFSHKHLLFPLSRDNTALEIAGKGCIGNIKRIVKKTQPCRNVLSLKTIATHIHTHTHTHISYLCIYVFSHTDMVL